MNKSIIEKLFNLNGEVAIVTGAEGQLGGEYVKVLLDAGVFVAAIDIKDGASDINSEKLIYLKADITKKSDLENVLNVITEKFGVPTVLVNNAAIDAPPNASEKVTGPFETYPEEAWDAMMEVNLKGMFLCCQVFGEAMAKNKGGSIVNISSIYGLLSPDQRIYEYKPKKFVKPVAYSVAKSGVLNLTRYLATYWAKQNVRVNTLTLAGVYNDQDENFVKNYTSRMPMGRMANKNEYSGALIFLASKASSYMTGANLVIDGGWTAW